VEVTVVHEMNQLVEPDVTLYSRPSSSHNNEDISLLTTYQAALLL